MSVEQPPFCSTAPEPPDASLTPPEGLIAAGHVGCYAGLPVKAGITICSRHEAACLQDKAATHLLSIANPGAQIAKPTWFTGKHLCLFFGDVVSEADARQCNTTPPAIHDIANAVQFARSARTSRGELIIHCEYGASRSPAMAYVIVADRLGIGCEAQALDTVLELRPGALPNKLVVALGDKFLDRGGKLIQPLKDFYAEVNRELEGCFKHPLR
jgi:predicted protein tyrosine phosphatase